MPAGFAAVMKTDEGIEVLKLTANVLGQVRTVYPTLLWDEEAAILVDTGFPHLLPDIQSAMAGAGVPFDRLNKIILTHQDLDHIGGLLEILKAGAGKIEVMAHEEEKPYIQGEKPLIKYNPRVIEGMLQTLPLEQRKRAALFFGDLPKADVGKVLSDGDELPYCGGIKVVFTPGHSPGHISLYLKKSKTLIAGDALMLAEGKLFPSPPEISSDPDLARESLKKFAGLDIKTVICYHGGVYQGEIEPQLFA